LAAAVPFSGGSFSPQGFLRAPFVANVGLGREVYGGLSFSAQEFVSSIRAREIFKGLLILNGKVAPLWHIYNFTQIHNRKKNKIIIIYL
jgi:hypothetical protein